jgi:hypothetical protein
MPGINKVDLAAGVRRGPARFFSASLLLVALAASLATTPAMAAPKACEDLKAEIEAKIQAQGVTSYTLEIVTAKEALGQDPAMVVGSCNYGRMKIVYQKNDR